MHHDKEHKIKKHHKENENKKADVGRADNAGQHLQQAFNTVAYMLTRVIALYNLYNTSHTLYYYIG